MLIKKKRINSLEKYFSDISEEKIFYVSVPADAINTQRLSLKKLVEGMSIVPKVVGTVTKFNLWGKVYADKTQEKEAREFERDYHVVDWHGNDHYGTCFQTRMCYPKKQILPPLIEIIYEREKLISNQMTMTEPEIVKHTINMFLELFGYCEIIDVDKKSIVKTPKVKMVSWKILPPGKYPWEKVEKALEDYFVNAPGKNKNVLRNNHKELSQLEPDFLAIGENSFNGYVVYGYSSRNLYVFESNQMGNATYVFKGDWEKASQLTKYEIIQGDLCYKRIIHTKEWISSVKALFE